MAFGRPAKVVRELNEEDIKDMLRISREYAEKGQYYKSLQQQIANTLQTEASYNVTS